MVPFDENVTEADHLGRALIDHMPTAAAVLALEELAEQLAERLGTAASVASGQ
jgi:MinD-like ATPase involved in chromosome partitioning or flagellar assembly